MRVRSDSADAGELVSFTDAHKVGALAAHNDSRISQWFRVISDASANATSWVRPSSALDLPRCVRGVLQHGVESGLEPLRDLEHVAIADWTAWAKESVIDHAYVLHYSGNVVRRAYQEVQLRQLGLPVSFVTAYDGQRIDDTVRACRSLANLDATGIEPNISIASIARTPRFSASLKLYVALYDLVRRSLRAALVLEDDVRVHWDKLPLLAAATVNATLAPRPHALRVLFAGSYAPNGYDMLCCNTKQRRVDNTSFVRMRPRQHRKGTGLMPASATVVTNPGARHIVQSLPITDNNDVLLSDVRTRSGRQPGLWYIKPYPFTPAPELQEESLDVWEGRPHRRRSVGNLWNHTKHLPASASPPHPRVRPHTQGGAAGME